MLRRMFILLLAISGCFFVIIMRLFWIQVAATERFSAKHVDLVRRSIAQREMSLELQSGRGDFYDRNMHPLTGQKGFGLAVFPTNDHFRGNSADIYSLTRMLHTSSEAWQAFIDRLDRPAFWRVRGSQSVQLLSADQLAKLSELSIPKIHILPAYNRYSDSEIARHLIGFIAENPQLVTQHYADRLASGALDLSAKIGVAGLEKTFDSYLLGIGSPKVSFYTDGENKPLNGLGLRLNAPSNPLYPVKIVTTLDSGIQRLVEQAMDESGITDGSAVVLDASTADVLAMASRPQFNPDRITGDSHWGNKALMAIAPGSVFKTVVMAAVLEYGKSKPDERYYCGGELGKYGFSCWKKAGHGWISLRDAFAESCNITFAKAAGRLTPEQLLHVAGALGLNRTVGWKDENGFTQLDGEQSGAVFLSMEQARDEGVMVQTSIGQRDVRMTPLQGANLVVTLLNGGKGYASRVVKQILYANDLPLKRFAPQPLNPGRQAISLRSAQEIVRDMRRTVESGTASGLKNARWELAGKTGTAQIAASGAGRVNQWFIGFGPYASPRYAISVVAGNRPDNSPNLSLTAVKRIMDGLAALGSG